MVALGNRVAMKEKLEVALSRVLSIGAALRKEVSPITPEAEKVAELGVLAIKYYYKAKEYLQKGDWVG
jgi:hypothetical protein